MDSKEFNQAIKDKQEADNEYLRPLSRAERREKSRMDKKSCKKIMKAVNKHSTDPLENRCRMIFSEMLEVSFNNVLSKISTTVNCLIENQERMERNIETLYLRVSGEDSESIKSLKVIMRNVNSMSDKIKLMNNAIEEIRGNELCTVHEHEHSLNGKPVNVYAFRSTSDASKAAAMFRGKGFQCVRSGNVLYCIEHKLEEVPATAGILFDYIVLLIVGDLHSRAYMMLSALNKALNGELRYSYNVPVEKANAFINMHICDYDSNKLTETLVNDPTGYINILIKDKLSARTVSEYQMRDCSVVIKSVNSVLYYVNFDRSSKIVELVRV